MLLCTATNPQFSMAQRSPAGDGDYVVLSDSRLSCPKAPNGTFRIEQRDYAPPGYGTDTYRCFVVHDYVTVPVRAERLNVSIDGAADSDHLGYQYEFFISGDSRYVYRQVKVEHGIDHAWIYRVGPRFNLVNVLGDRSLDDCAWNYLRSRHRLGEVGVVGQHGDETVNPGGFDDRIVRLNGFYDRNGCYSAIFDVSGRRGDAPFVQYRVRLCLRSAAIGE
jgi:hypothetical protein